MKKAEQILEKHSDIKVSEVVNSKGFNIPYGVGMATIHIKDKPLFTIEQALMAMKEYAEQQAIEFVKWANDNCWYKHYDQNDNCWTSRDEKRTETTENLYREFVLAVSPFTEKKYCR